MRSCSWAISLCPQRRSRLRARRKRSRGRWGIKRAWSARQRAPSCRLRARAARASRPNGSTWLASSRPGARLSTAILIVLGAGLAWFAARETPVFSVKTIEVAGAPRPGERAGQAIASRDRRHEPAQVRRRYHASDDPRPADGCERSLRPGLPAHTSGRRRPGAGSCRRSTGRRLVPHGGERPHHGHGRAPHRPALARIWIKRDVQLQVGVPRRG